VAEKKAEYEVTVISRDEVTTFPKIAQPVVNILITYVAADLPPATITIPKAQWTAEYEKRLIREDIERRMKVRPESFRV
jgi:hypothetical protein